MEWWIRASLLCWLLTGAHAQANDDKALTLTYINHPVIVDTIMPIVKQAYDSLDIPVTFVEQPSARNLRMTVKGVTDGDVAYSSLLVKRHADLVTVGPSFFESIFVLLCYKDAHCDESVLSDATKTVFLTDASRDGLQMTYQDRLTVDLYAINSLDRIPKLIDGRRLVYGIYVTTDTDKSLSEYPDLHYVELFRSATHHVLHKRHHKIFPAVSNALTVALQDLSG